MEHNFRLEKIDLPCSNDTLLLLYRFSITISIFILFFLMLYAYVVKG